MKPVVKLIPVRGGPEGRTLVRLEQSIRQRRPRFSLRFVVLTYVAGWASAVLSALAALM